MNLTRASDIADITRNAFGISNFDNDLIRSRSVAQKNGDLVSKATYMKIVRERDELLKMLHKFENHTAEIEANVRVLSRERDRSHNLYEQVPGGRLRDPFSAKRCFVLIVGPVLRARVPQCKASNNLLITSCE